MPSRPRQSAADPVLLAFSSDPMSVRRALRALAKAALLRTLSPPDRGTVELVLGEVLNNIVEHAYARAPGPISLHLAPAAGGIACHVADHGLAMLGDRAPDGVLPAGLDGPPAGLPEGGFGWFLIRSLTRDLGYERKDGQNHLRFTLPIG